MFDMHDMLLYSGAAGLLNKLKGGMAAGVTGVNLPRIEAAMLAVELSQVLTFLFTKDPAKQTEADLTALLDKEITDREKSGAPPLEPKQQRAHDTLKAAKPELTRLFALIRTIGAGDTADINAMIKDEGIRGFREVIGEPTVFTQGQFVLSSGGWAAFQAVMVDERKALSLPTAEDGQFVHAWQTIVDAVSHSHPGRGKESYQQVQAAAFKSLATFKKLAADAGKTLSARFLQAYRPVIGPPQKNVFEEAIQQEWAPLWAQWLKSKTLPDMSAESNVYKLCWLQMADLWACAPMTTNLADLYDAKAKGTANDRNDPSDPDAAAKRKSTAFGGLQLYQKLPPKRDPAGPVVDQRVTYSPELPKHVERMRAALDAGWFVHVRVMSGAMMDDTANVANAEHSLLIVRARGNAFFCADMDPGNEGSAELMTGSTALFFDPGANTFATAPEAGLAVDEHGHQKTNFRHRYQATTASTR
jgi:hypothetical protein